MGLLEIPRQSDKIISRIEHGRTNWIWFSQRECNHKNKILNQFRNGKKLTCKDGLLVPLIKQLTEAALALHEFKQITDLAKSIKWLSN